VAISGFGNVAWGAALKVTELGGKVVTLSGPDGYVLDEEGISGAKIEYMLELRASNEDIVAPYALEFDSGQFIQGKRPWEVKVDIALPCATQNELDEDDAEQLIANGCICVCEGANMPCTPKPSRSSRRSRSCTLLAKQPMQGEWPPPDWKWPRIP
jgi:glutamate dehydrogenase (NADP+)